MIRAEDGYVQHPTTLIANDRTESLQLHSANGAGLTMTSSDLSYGVDLSSAGQASRNRMSDTNGASVVLVTDERRNGGSNSNNGAMASRSLIANEQLRLVNSSDNMQGMQGKSGSTATLPAQYTTNSSLIKNFKNGKAEKKGKTFLSRISSGFRFSFRNKSKKGGGGTVGPGMLKESSSFTAPTAVNNNNNINAKVGGRGGSSSGNDSASADFIYIPLKDPH
uniref:Uncharacterized protein n=1 Tax=Anopheles maculatus TaxID=74869 RepID=A0A182S7C5_9DIPT